MSSIQLYAVATVFVLGISLGIYVLGLSLPWAVACGVALVYLYHWFLDWLASSILRPQQTTSVNPQWRKRGDRYRLQRRGTGTLTSSSSSSSLPSVVKRGFFSFASPTAATAASTHHPVHHSPALHHSVSQRQQVGTTRPRFDHISGPVQQGGVDGDMVPSPMTPGNAFHRTGARGDPTRSDTPYSTNSSQSVIKNFLRATATNDDSQALNDSGYSNIDPDLFPRHLASPHIPWGRAGDSLTPYQRHVLQHSRHTPVRPRRWFPWQRNSPTKTKPGREDIPIGFSPPDKPQASTPVTSTTSTTNTSGQEYPSIHAMSPAERDQYLLQLVQGSEAWLHARKSLYTASNFGTMIGVNQYERPCDRWLLSTGQVVDQREPSVDMVRGNMLEGYVADWVQLVLQSPLEELGIICDPVHTWLAASLDRRFTQDKQRIVEIKCPRHLYERIPDRYMAQVQGQLHIARARVCFFAIFVRGVPSETEESLHIWKVDYSEAYWQWMYARLSLYRASVELQDQAMAQTLSSEDGTPVSVPPEVARTVRAHLFIRKTRTIPADAIRVTGDVPS